MPLDCRFIEVTVVRAWDLIAADVGGASDPFVIVSGKGRIPKDYTAKTSVKKSCLDPAWDEHFALPAVRKTTKNTVIMLTVFDHDRLGADDFMGFAEIVLTEERIERLAMGSTDYTLFLGPRKGHDDDKELFEACDRNLGRLEVKLRSVVRNLAVPEDAKLKGFEATYITAELNCGGKPARQAYCCVKPVGCLKKPTVNDGRFKTSQCPAPNPKWDERFHLEIDAEKRAAKPDDPFVFTTTVLDAASEPVDYFLGFCVSELSSEQAAGAVGTPVKKALKLMPRLGNKDDEARAEWKKKGAFGVLYVEIRASVEGMSGREIVPVPANMKDVQVPEDGDKELRMDVTDGGWYPLESFLEFYGGTQEWDMAPKKHEIFPDGMPPKMPDSASSEASDGDDEDEVVGGSEKAESDGGGTDAADAEREERRKEEEEQQQREEDAKRAEEEEKQRREEEEEATKLAEEEKRAEDEKRAAEEEEEKKQQREEEEEAAKLAEEEKRAEEEEEEEKKKEEAEEQQRAEEEKRQEAEVEAEAEEEKPKDDDSTSGKDDASTTQRNEEDKKDDPSGSKLGDAGGDEDRASMPSADGKEDGAPDVHVGDDGGASVGGSVGGEVPRSDVNDADGSGKPLSRQASKAASVAEEQPKSRGADEADDDDKKSAAGTAEPEDEVRERSVSSTVADDAGEQKGSKTSEPDLQRMRSIGSTMSGKGSVAGTGAAVPQEADQAQDASESGSGGAAVERKHTTASVKDPPSASERKPSVSVPSRKSSVRQEKSAASTACVSRQAEKSVPVEDQRSRSTADRTSNAHTPSPEMEGRPASKHSSAAPDPNPVPKEEKRRADVDHRPEEQPQKDARRVSEPQHSSGGVALQKKESERRPLARDKSTSQHHMSSHTDVGGPIPHDSRAVNSRGASLHSGHPERSHRARRSRSASDSLSSTSMSSSDGSVQRQRSRSRDPSSGRRDHSPGSRDGKAGRSHTDDRGDRDGMSSKQRRKEAERTTKEERRRQEKEERRRRDEERRRAKEAQREEERRRKEDKRRRRKEEEEQQRREKERKSKKSARNKDRNRRRRASCSSDDTSRRTTHHTSAPPTTPRSSTSANASHGRLRGFLSKLSKSYGSRSTRDSSTSKATTQVSYSDTIDEMRVGSPQSESTVHSRSGVKAGTFYGMPDRGRQHAPPPYMHYYEDGRVVMHQRPLSVEGPRRQYAYDERYDPLQDLHGGGGRRDEAFRDDLERERQRRRRERSPDARAPYSREGFYGGGRLVDDEGFGRGDAVHGAPWSMEQHHPHRCHTGGYDYAPYPQSRDSRHHDHPKESTRTPPDDPYMRYASRHAKYSLGTEAPPPHALRSPATLDRSADMNRRPQAPPQRHPTDGMGHAFATFEHLHTRETDEMHGIPFGTAHDTPLAAITAPLGNGPTQRASGYVLPQFEEVGTPEPTVDVDPITGARLGPYAPSLGDPTTAAMMYGLQVGAQLAALQAQVQPKASPSKKRSENKKQSARKRDRTEHRRGVAAANPLQQHENSHRTREMRADEKVDTWIKERVDQTVAQWFIEHGPEPTAPPSSSPAEAPQPATRSAFAVPAQGGLVIPKPIRSPVGVSTQQKRREMDKESDLEWFVNEHMGPNSSIASIDREINLSELRKDQAKRSERAEAHDPKIHLPRFTGHAPPHQSAASAAAAPGPAARNDDATTSTGKPVSKVNSSSRSAPSLLSKVNHALDAIVSKLAVQRDSDKESHGMRRHDHKVKRLESQLNKLEAKLTEKEQASLPPSQGQAREKLGGRIPHASGGLKAPHYDGHPRDQAGAVSANAREAHARRTQRTLSAHRDREVRSSHREREQGQDRDRCRSKSATQRRPAQGTSAGELMTVLRNLRDDTVKMVDVQKRMGRMTRTVVTDAGVRDDADEVVRSWLRALALQHYAPLFKEHGVGPEQVPRLNDADLRTMGVYDSTSRQRILTSARSAPPFPACSTPGKPTQTDTLAGGQS